MFKKSSRLKSIHFDTKLGIEECSLPDIEPGPYVIDDSNFIPMSEAIKQLNRINDPSNGILSQVYDFPNGKDNGKQIPLFRRHDIKDIAVISAEISRETKDLAEKLSEGYEIAYEQQQFEKSFKDIKDNSNLNNKT